MNGPQLDFSHVVLRYAQAIAANKDVTCDIKQLPFSKKTIMNALEYYIIHEKDKQSSEQLEFIYVCLADFQALTDDERKAVNIMENMGKLPNFKNGKFQELIVKIKRFGPVYRELRNRILEESQRLQAELNNLRTH